MQMTSDLINEKIDRPAHFDMSCLGAASLAGLAVGMCALYKKGCFCELILIHKMKESIWKARVYTSVIHLTVPSQLYKKDWEGGAFQYQLLQSLARDGLR